MSIDAASFKAEFPEFQDAPDDLVASNLLRAQEVVNPGVWDAMGLTEQGTFVYCARLLALSPFARKMGLVNDKGVTNYDARWKHMQLLSANGFRVL